MMLRFQQGDRLFSMRAAGIGLHENRVLLLQLEGDDYWYIPGGRVEMGESAEETLKREIREEINADVTVHGLVFVIENFFKSGGLTCHEIGMYFRMSLPPEITARTQPWAGSEGDDMPLIFEWVALDALSQRIVRPLLMAGLLSGSLDKLQHIVHIDPSYEHFIRDDENQSQPDENAKTAVQAPIGKRVINQGEIYWIAFGASDDRANVPHPHVVVQEDVLNHSRIKTVVVCALTSNVRRVNIPGNVLLEAGEANLLRQSVVEVSKVLTVEKSQLGAYIGTLDERRIHQIFAGMRFLQTAFFSRDL